MANMLPDDILLFQILPRLPARSIGRSMCVCKQWHSFLTTPVFTKMHLHHVNNQNHHKLLVVSTTNPCKYFQTIDCETPELGLSAIRSLPFEANSKEMLVISSLNGLVCVSIDSLLHGSLRYSDIILWNPLTGDYKMLSKDNSNGKNFRIAAKGYGLYYSSCDDDHRLLRVTQSGDAYIYSLKSDSWRKVESTICCLLKYWNLSCVLNEKLYFLAQGRNKMNVWSYLIIRFDTKTETFTEIAAPCLEYIGTSCLKLKVVSECIHLCVSSKGIKSWDKLEVWKMDGDGEWTKTVSYCDKLCKHVFSRPLYLMKNGNWLVGSKGKGYVYKVDLEMKTAKEVCAYTDGEMDILWGGKFVETFVSLKR
ncbi:F-box/kelch-repeat protein At3g06240-like [Cynara cardunculus var. scolymus]|uniref:F-box/kelch-repeat protein At3g06240-like n=1 Tax=Cynara cardunculus var. scolymus TaxID=59895 RepID=UPI000D62D2C6|nr:F-box/kelch-repeat protein At3g06240-like [Cynara cardunculus var. scolymus]